MRTLPPLRRSLLVLLAAMSVLLMLPSAASALTVTRQSATSCDTASRLTDWSDTLSLPRFDMPGASLTAVTVSREVSITSDYRVESRNGAPRNDTLKLDGAYVELRTPGLPATIASMGASTRAYAFAAFDQVVDFGGTSGATGSFGTAAMAEIGDSTPISAWEGAGSVALMWFASAATDNTLSGNFRLEWDTIATVRACVTYTYTEEVLVCIGDYVWQDADENGVQEGSEHPVAGRTVTVTDAQGRVLGQTTTSSAGRWIVCGLEPSTACVVDVDLPAGWVITGRDKGVDDTLDSDGFASPAGDAMIPCVTPPSGSDLTFDVGIYQPRVPDAVPTPAPSPARVSMTKSSNTNSIRSRGRVTFIVRVRNRGQVAVRNLRVCDTPPSQLAFTSKPRGSKLRNGQLCWTARSLGARRTVTYRYTMRAANVATRQCVVNRATATSTSGGSAAARDSVCIRATKLGVLQLAG